MREGGGDRVWRRHYGMQPHSLSPPKPPTPPRPVVLLARFGRNSGRGFVYKLVTVDSLAAYCDEPPPSAPPRRPPASSPPTENATGRVEIPSSPASTVDGSAAAAAVAGVPGGPETVGDETVGNDSAADETAGFDSAADEAVGDKPGARRKRGGTAACRSFLAAGLSDEDLEGMFRTSLAGGEDGHSYVVVPASPSFRLRVQRGGDGGGGGSDGGGSSKYKVEAFFHDVSERTGNVCLCVFFLEML